MECLTCKKDVKKLNEHKGNHLCLSCYKKYVDLLMLEDLQDHFNPKWREIQQMKCKHNNGNCVVRTIETEQFILRYCENCPSQIQYVNKH